MLVLSRKVGERIIIEPGIEIAVVDVQGGRVRIGIAAPPSVGIRRNEVPARRTAAPQVAAQAGIE